jgi:uncharacterized repeat protein (TIGR01451 family)
MKNKIIKRGLAICLSSVLLLSGSGVQTFASDIQDPLEVSSSELQEESSSSEEDETSSEEQAESNSDSDENVLEESAEVNIIPTSTPVPTPANDVNDINESNAVAAEEYKDQGSLVSEEQENVSENTSGETSSETPEAKPVLASNVFDVSESPLSIVQQGDGYKVFYRDTVYEDVSLSEIYLEGSSNVNTIYISSASGITVNVKNLNISSEDAPLTLEGKCDLNLEGESNLYSSKSSHSVVLYGDNTEVTVKGDGSLLTKSVSSTEDSSCGVLVVKSGLVSTEGIGYKALYALGGNIQSSSGNILNSENVCVYKATVSGLNSLNLVSPIVFCNDEPYTYGQGLVSRDGNYTLYLPEGDAEVEIGEFTYVGTVTKEGTVLVSLEEYSSNQDIQVFSKKDLEESDDLKESDDFEEEDAVLLSNDAEDLSYISAYEISKVIDGTAPFDSDDAAGNDSGDSNGIVRSFDTVNYTLKYTTALRDTAVSGVDEADVMVDFCLPCDPTVAQFNIDTMNWCQDLTITYEYSDGTSSTTWDKSKTVSNQRLTGKRHLANSESGNTIPGTGTLSTGIKVQAATNGLVLNPSFSIWVNGNADSDKKTVTNQIQVSAAPKYNIKLARNGTLNLLGYYDLNSGDVSLESKENTKYGRLQGYSVEVAIKNDTAAKGIKGIELPSGDITFDISMAEFVNSVNVSDDDKYTPILWDYRMNVGGGVNTRGTLGRNMASMGESFNCYSIWQTNSPLNKGGGTGACYDGGNMAMSQDSSNENLWHVSLTGYKFDTTNFVFPDRWSGAPYKSIQDNIGVFSVGYFQVLCQFPTVVQNIENVQLEVTASNINATSASGTKVTTEVDMTDNKSSVALTTYPAGSHSKRNFFYTESGSYTSSTWDAGDSYTYLGAKVQINGQMTYTGDGYLRATNILQKFDDEAFEVLPGTTRYCGLSLANPISTLGYVNTLFAAKPDKSGWSSDDEMNSTREENLVYFRTIDELTSAGYTCVGVLYEVRNSKIYPWNAGAGISISTMVKVKKTATAGVVYMTKNDVRSWKDSGEPFSWLNVPNSNGSYGLGNTSWSEGSYTTGYPQPSYLTYLPYGKAVYREGTMVGGHTNGYQGGNSLLVIGDKTSVGIKVADKSSSGQVKSVYDLDLGERTATFTVSPICSIASSNSEVSTTSLTDNVTVKVVLPKGLSYNDTGVSTTPKSVTPNSDGTTTVVWYFENVKVGGAMEPITFSTTIGEEGTKNDVSNNDTFTVTTAITSDLDTRKVLASNGNYSETTITVIKLAASAVTKKVMNPLVESGQNIEYRLRYSNLSDTAAENTRLYDILPHKRDNRGTSYSGGYAVTKIVMDFSNAKNTFSNGSSDVKLFYTTDNNARTASEADAKLHGTSTVTYRVLSGTVGDNTITWSNLSIQDATALYTYIGYTFGHEYIDTYITISPLSTSGSFIQDGNGGRQQPGDVYANNFYQYADNQAAVVTSNIVSAKVVKRTISGLVWVDRNADNLRGSQELLFSGADVALYRSDKSGYDSGSSILKIDGKSLYKAYDVFGSVVSSVKTDGNGKYNFDYLEAGTYYVVVTGVSDYRLSNKDVGDDDTVDSDAFGILSTKDKTIEKAYIAEITLPDIKNMTNYAYESANNDVGLIKGITQKLPETGSCGTVLLVGLGCIFVLLSLRKRKFA